MHARVCARERARACDRACVRALFQLTAQRHCSQSSRTAAAGITHWQSPSFFAYYPANSSFVSLLGDMLSGALNMIGFSWISSPACTELETVCSSRITVSSCKTSFLPQAAPCPAGRLAVAVHLSYPVLRNLTGFSYPARTELNTVQPSVPSCLQQLLCCGTLCSAGRCQLQAFAALAVTAPTRQPQLARQLVVRLGRWTWAKMCCCTDRSTRRAHSTCSWSGSDSAGLAGAAAGPASTLSVAQGSRQRGFGSCMSDAQDVLLHTPNLLLSCQLQCPG